jgi:ATP-binding cassette subfamily C protein
LAALLVLTSLTEGLGLLMLVPLTQILAGQPAVGLEAQWVELLAQFSPALLLGLVVALVGIRAAIVYLTNERRRTMGLSLSRQLRGETHKALLRAKWLWLGRQSSADHAALIMGETVRAGNLVDYALSFASSIVAVIVLLATAALLSIELTLIMLVAGAVLAIPLLFLRASTSSNAEAYSDAYADLQGLVSNGLEHLRAARIANATHVLELNFAKYSSRLQQYEVGFFRAGHRAQALFQIALAASLALAIYAALFWGSVSLVIFVPMLAIAIRCAAMLLRIQQAAHNWRYNVTALEQLQRLIADAHANVEPQVENCDPLRMSREFALRAVQFTYPGRDRPVVTDFDCTITRGDILGVRGASGAGKSTLADLCAGLLRPDKGAVAIDGATLNDAQVMQWRSQVAYVEQSGFFLDGTIAENLAWGLDRFDEDQMVAALQAASAEFVFDLSDGLQSSIGEGARQLSGGEKQRIALARALMRQPDLLILDEITSGLDSSSKARVISSIAGLKGQYTILLLSHDDAMLAIADGVVDLDQM